MAKFIEVSGLFKKINHKQVHTILDSLTFPYILMIWIIMIISFGFIYYAIHNDFSHLIYSNSGEMVNSIDDAIYFSFVTATTTGFGDIVPVGGVKALAVLEVVFGWLLFAIVTSKFVSIKQDMILGELYEWSINEKVMRIRASLLLFRQNLDRLLTKIEEKRIQKREINNLYVFISSLEDSLREISELVSKADDELIKSVDNVQTELIVNSIISSLTKLNETIGTMKEAKLEWKQNLTVDLIKRCIGLTDKVFLNIALSKKMNRQTSADVNERKDQAIGILKTLIG